MTPLLAAAAIVALLLGIILCGLGLRRVAPPEPSASARPLILPGRLANIGSTTMTARTRALLAAGFAVGLLAWIFTGWAIAVIVVPAATVGIPLVLGLGGAPLITRLEAMEEWTRSLAGVLTAGVGLEQALKVTLRSTPDAIRPEVALLVARLGARWPVDSALRAFADDLDDPTGDIIVFYLLSGAHRRGSGLAAVLEALATSVAEDVRNRRAVEADRAQPRATARWVTLITVAVLAGMVLLRSGYISTYKSGLGQLLLFTLLGTYAACLIWMQRIARGTTAPRFLTSNTARPGSVPRPAAAPATRRTP